MTENRITILIEKFVRHDLSTKEADELLKWLKEDQANIDLFNSQLEINYLLSKNEQNFNSSEAYAKIEALLEDSKPVKDYKWTSLLKYAAIFIGIIGLGFYFFNSSPSGISPDATPEFVTLELENGKMEKINLLEQNTIVNSKGQIIGTKGENSLNYEKAAPTKELVYNTLWIPYGKKFELVLSDGSEIVLNSGTTIKYPIYFLPHRERKVFLKGEAYFKVAKDSLHQFVVSTQKQDVFVYGTKFNVSAYENEELTKTVLVEGSVGVSSGKSIVKIIPGEMAISGKGMNSIEIKKVDPTEYIAWVQNETVFVGERFSEIIKTLERKFDVTIINNYKALNDQVFTATFEDEKLEEILNLFSKSRPFDYTIKEDKIIITKQKKEGVGAK